MEEFVSPPSNSASALLQENICENTTILDEGISLCPLCASELRMFFINFNMKIQMCENADCDYPFGHENVVYEKEDDEARSDDEVASIASKTVRGSFDTSSMISTVAWSEISKASQISDVDQNLDSQTDIKHDDYLHIKRYKKNEMKNNSKNPTVQKQTKNLTKGLVETNDDDDDIDGKTHLKNEKWLKNLMYMQNMTGVTLLKPNEIRLLDRKKTKSDAGELKIDINMGDQSKMSTVKIEISNLKT